MKNFAPACSALLLLLLLTSCQEEETKPNILFLFTDDQTYTALHALGNEEIETPNLDRLVAKGTTFTHAYNMGAWQGAVCLASRAMINSGRSVWRAEAMTRRWKNRDSTAMTQNWGPLLQRAGYATYFSGKWHVDAPAEEQFEYVRHVRPGMPPDGYPFPPINALRKRHGGYPPLDSLRMLLPPGYNRPLSAEDTSWNPSDTRFGGFWKGGKHWSEVLADDGEDFLAQAADDERPFFMYLAFNAPHDPRQAPAEYLARYNPTELQLPASYADAYPDLVEIGIGPGLRDEDLAPYPRTPLAVKKHQQEYYALITHLDAQVGRILAALDSSGKADDTVILFTADHGLAVGRHGLLGKQNLYDHSIRVPLVLTGPGIPRGVKVNTDVYLQDVMPTTLELAGVDKPAYVEFHSLLPLLEEKSAAPYPAVYGAYVNWQRSIRKGGYKLIVYPEVPTLKLFHLATDPEEMNNLAAEEPLKAAALFADLQALQQSMGDTLQLQLTDYQRPRRPE